MKEKLLIPIAATAAMALSACSGGGNVETVPEATSTTIAVDTTSTVNASGVEPRLQVTTTTEPVVEVKAKVVDPDHEDVPTVTIEPPEIAYGGDMEQIICEVFGPNCAKAIAVAKCESGLNPTAVSRTNDHGLFQLHKDSQRVADALWWDAQLGLGLGWDAIYNPYVNSYLAHSQSNGGSNFSSWTCG